MIAILMISGSVAVSLLLWVIGNIIAEAIMHYRVWRKWKRDGGSK